MDQKKKKRITVIALIVLLLLFVGGTLAYLTSNQSQNNTFTAGKVSISLDEAVVKKNDSGNYVADGEKRTSENQSYHLYPAMTVVKDPTITVSSDSETAYVAAIITVKGDIYELLKGEGTDDLDLSKLLSGGLLDESRTETEDWNGLTVSGNDHFVLYQKADKTQNTWTLYLFMEGSEASNSVITLFETLTVPSSYDNEEMAKINGMSIEVAAYATQTNGFDSCYQAMTTAFSNVFSFGSN